MELERGQCPLSKCDTFLRIYEREIAIGARQRAGRKEKEQASGKGDGKRSK